MPSKSTPSAATVERVHAVLTYEQPQSVAQIAKIARLSDSTVRKALAVLAQEHATVDPETAGWKLTAAPKMTDAEYDAALADARGDTASKAPAAKATKAPAKAAAATKATAAEKLAATLKADGDKAKAVPGYELRWPHGAYDLYKATDKAPENSPQWVIRCTAHGTTTTAADVKAADAKGRRSDRPSWCKGCKSDASKAPAKAAKAPAAKGTKATKATPIKSAVVGKAGSALMASITKAAQ